ncbi:MAG: polysaccharide deacetylase family protein [Bacteroidales bacterium]|nr:polysaccharide deacetylase family protein [Bacteroidales bacterium]MBN2762752.1 polysaccharide deacetylase family protein [Bacteroidales bacterium]
MLPTRIPGLVKRLYHSLTWDLYNCTDSVFLTFDDGPTPGVTKQVLDILKAFDALATFFCIGRNAERNPELISMIRSAGHIIGNHTYSHLNGMKTRNRDYYNDIQLARSFTPSELFRPPYGMISPSQIKHLKKQYTIIMWDIMSYDYDPAVSREKCLDNVITSVRPGSVVVFHDSLKASEKVLYALPRVLEFVKEKGWKGSPLRLPIRGRERKDCEC